MGPGLRKFSAQFHRRIKHKIPVYIVKFEVSSAAEVLCGTFWGTLCSVPASAFFLAHLWTVDKSFSSLVFSFVSGDNKMPASKGSWEIEMK